MLLAVDGVAAHKSPPMEASRVRTGMAGWYRRLRSFKLSLLAALSMSVWPAAAQDAELWLYTCDHFLGSACLRLPNFMSVSYEVPTGFGLHQVSAKSGMSLTLYEGDARSRSISEDAPSLSFSADGREVTGYHQSKGTGREVVDVVVLQGGSGKGAVHLHVLIESEAQRADAARVLAGFRPCRLRISRRETTQSCPRVSSIGERLAAWLMASKVDDG